MRACVRVLLESPCECACMRACVVRESVCMRACMRVLLESVCVRACVCVLLESLCACVRVRAYRVQVEDFIWIVLLVLSVQLGHFVG